MAIVIPGAGATVKFKLGMPKDKAEPSTVTAFKPAVLAVPAAKLAS